MVLALVRGVAPHGTTGCRSQYVRYQNGAVAVGDRLPFRPARFSGSGAGLCLINLVGVLAVLEFFQNRPLPSRTPGMVSWFDLLSWVLLCLGGGFVLIGELAPCACPVLYPSACRQSHGHHGDHTDFLRHHAAGRVFPRGTETAGNNAVPAADQAYGELRLANAALQSGCGPKPNGWGDKQQGVTPVDHHFALFLLSLLVITAIAIVRTENLFVAVMLTSIFSLLMAANFFILDAADVALTEAGGGSGITTVIFLSALALTTERERAQTRQPHGPAGGGGAGDVDHLRHLRQNCAWATPRPRAHAPGALVPEKTPEYVDIPNVVTAVLGSFRGYDTLGEVFVVFAACIGVLFILGVKPGRRGGGTLVWSGLKHHLIPRWSGGC